MIDEQHLREGLQRLLRYTEVAIRERISDEPSMESHLRDRHAAAVRAGRTAGSVSGYNSFADEAITQSGVHWLLGCVFVRFLEDNGWLDERNKVVAWLAGPDERLAIAKGERTRFLRPDPALTDRDYLLYVFSEVTKLPGTAGLFDPRHNPLFQLGPTAQGAAKIVEFFQKVDPDTGGLIYDFTDTEHGTRFLGDLYQNLSESARQRYALCQTPGFVIDFILDRTLTPAIDTFGLDRVRMIDPSCGSGHFLLAAFARLFHLWQQREPVTNPAALAQRSLDAVHGVDLNPFASEISRFRLLIAALEASGVTRLRDALDFRIQVVAGDSLLHGTRPHDVGAVQRGLYEDRLQFFYATEDESDTKRILSQVYHVVVGNPPYINVEDLVLREAYRSRFSTCSGSYQLGVPFTERFFDLVVPADDPREAAGWLGMIVSNAFMSRTFGRALVEKYLRRKDLTHVIDTSGLNLPGHGTPTVILLARNRTPLESTPVRLVRGIVGILTQGEDLVNSPLWREIVERVDEPGYEGLHISVADAPRQLLATHPWGMGGGGAAELKVHLDRTAAQVLSSMIEESGRMTHTGDDEAFYLTPHSARTLGIFDWCKTVVVGGNLRDWALTPTNVVLFPYTEDGADRSDFSLPVEKNYWWLRTALKHRRDFGQFIEQRGLRWQNHSMFFPDRFTSRPVIGVGEIATHNHFVFDGGGKVFNQTAPILKLKETTVDRYMGILGALNSSVGCFWLRQVAHDKGGGGVGGGLSSEPWERRKCFTVTVIAGFPVPEVLPCQLATLLQTEVEARGALSPENLCISGIPSRSTLDTAAQRAEVHLARMIALQEELDWQCYKMHGIIEEDLTAPLDQLPLVKLGQRAFEIRLARQMDADDSETTWFERHRSQPITDFPHDWPEAYRQICTRRLEVTEQNRAIGLVEQPQYKRRWNLPTWQDMEQAALKNWMLDRIEANTIWQEAALLSCSQLRDALARDADWVSVASIYRGGPVENLDALVVELAVNESVPFLPVLRYTEEGLRKRCEWEQIWDLQRKEDDGEIAQIPVPPKYRSNDFLKSDYWRLRGGLDVPKERFILYPGLERDSDRSPVLGWAGWNHLQQAKALAGYCQRMRTEEGWEPERLKPVLAGLLDLKPWLLQWHKELDSETGVRPGEYFVQFAERQCQELGFSPEEVRAWQPTGTSSSRVRARRTTARRPQ